MTSWPQTRTVAKLYVSAQAHTSMDSLRKELDQTERLIADLGDEGQQTIQLLHSLDRIEDGLQNLASHNADLRVEQTRFERLLQQVRRHRRRIVRSDRDAIESARSQDLPDASRWWWFLDQTVARERRKAWLHRIGLGTAIVALLAAGWLGYQRFLAPPPEVRKAYGHIESGKSAIDAGNPARAAAQFELARELNPNDPEPWLWGGALCERSGGCADPERLYETAVTLYPSRFDFLLNRGRVYLESGQPEKASLDVKAALALNPDSGWSYYLRAGIAVHNGDYDAALDDLQLAADLADRSGENRLRGMAVTQRAQLVRLHLPAKLE